MFWLIIILIAVVLIIADIFKWFSDGIDKTGESLGLSKNQTNSALNLWAFWNMGKHKE